MKYLLTFFSSILRFFLIQINRRNLWLMGRSFFFLFFFSIVLIDSNPQFLLITLSFFRTWKALRRSFVPYSIFFCLFHFPSFLCLNLSSCALSFHCFRSTKIDGPPEAKVISSFHVTSCLLEYSIPTIIYFWKLCLRRGTREQTSIFTVILLDLYISFSP